jgi:hypothetical protein
MIPFSGVVDERGVISVLERKDTDCEGRWSVIEMMK